MVGMITRAVTECPDDARVKAVVLGETVLKTTLSGSEEGVLLFRMH